MLTGPSETTAKDFITTSRIKRWKPSDDSKRSGSCNAEYCYIDNDILSSNIDPMMIGMECSSMHPFFQNVPFITNAYNDESLDKTRNFPYNKCVFKIDEAKNTIQNKQTFWDKINDSKCDLQVADINRYIVDLTIKAKACTQTLKDVHEKYMSLFQLHRGTVARREHYETTLSTCNRRLAFLQNENATVHTDFLEQLRIFNELMHDCAMRIPNLVTKAMQYKSLYDTLYESDSNVVSSIKRYKYDIKSKLRFYEEKQAFYENIQVQLDILKGYIAELEQYRDVIIQGEMKCKITLNACTVKRDSYEIDRETKSKALDILIVNLKNCQDTLNICLTKLNGCMTESARELIIVSDLKRRLERCDEELRICKQTLKQQSELVNSQSVYMHVLIERKKLCVTVTQEVGEIMDDIELTKDENAEKRKRTAQVQDAIYALNKTNLEVSGSELAACTGKTIGFPSAANSPIVPNIHNIPIASNQALRPKPVRPPPPPPPPPPEPAPPPPWVFHVQFWSKKDYQGDTFVVSEKGNTGNAERPDDKTVNLVNGTGFNVKSVKMDNAVVEFFHKGNVKGTFSSGHIDANINIKDQDYFRIKRPL
jgi:hypothetical protein